MKNQNNKVCECLETGSHLALLPAAEHGPALLTSVCTMRVCAALSSMLLCLTGNEGEGEPDQRGPVLLPVPVATNIQRSQ